MLSFLCHCSEWRTCLGVRPQRAVCARVSDGSDCSGVCDACGHFPLHFGPGGAHSSRLLELLLEWKILKNISRPSEWVLRVPRRKFRTPYGQFQCQQDVYHCSLGALGKKIQDQGTKCLCLGRFSLVPQTPLKFPLEQGKNLHFQSFPWQERGVAHKTQ